MVENSVATNILPVHTTFPSANFLGGSVVQKEKEIQRKTEVVSRGSLKMIEDGVLIETY